MLKSFASEYSFFFSSRASARVSSLISKQTCQVISLIGKSFARFLGKPWFCNSILCYSLEIFLSPFFDNLSKEELILLCQAFHPLNQVLILLVNLDAYKRFVSKLQVAAIRYLSRKMDKLRFEATSHLIRLARLGLGCLKPFNQSLSVSLSFMLTL